MEKAMIEAKYQAAVQQAELDHHTPTAGAMVGHIMANLTIQQRKLQQMKWYAMGFESLAFKTLLADLLVENSVLLDQTAQRLLDEDQLIPTTAAEYQEYGMLTEDARIQYWSVPMMTAELVRDYDTADLFVTRAIKLAQKEQRYTLANELIAMLGTNQHRIRLLQSLLNQAPREGLDEQDAD